MTLTSFTGCLLVLLAFPLYAKPAIAPFPLQRLAAGIDPFDEDTWSETPVIICKPEGADFHAETRLMYDEHAFYLKTVVHDRTKIFASREAVGAGEAHLSDSIEFWIGRRQFALALTSDPEPTVILYDYLKGRSVDVAEQQAEKRDDGYRVTVRVPWPVLEMNYSPGLFFQFALSFTDFDTPWAGPSVRRVRKQYWVPAAMKVDRPSTYGAAFLNDSFPVTECSAILAPLFLPEVEVAAFLPRNRLILYPSSGYENITIKTHVVSEFGRVRHERMSRLERDAVLLELPPGEKAGIERLDFYVSINGGDSFGPVSLEYFSSGGKRLREYRSEPEPPGDFDAFWDGVVAELAQEPMDPKKRWVRGNAGADLWEVDLRGWRGVRFKAFLSIPKARGAFPVVLSVYPASRITEADAKLDANNVVLWVSPRMTETIESSEALRRTLYVTDDPDPANFYLLANVLDYMRGIDFALTEENADPSRIFVSGGSRGGYLALALAATDRRITVVSSVVPCYADVDLMARLGTSSAAGDAYRGLYGGEAKRCDQMRRIWSYFDAVFLARRVTCPIVMEAGMLDPICPAPGIVDAFNRLGSKEKYLFLNPEHGHGGTEPGGAMRRLLQARSGRR